MYKHTSSASSVVLKFLFWNFFIFTNYERKPFFFLHLFDCCIAVVKNPFLKTPPLLSMIFLCAYFSNRSLYVISKNYTILFWSTWPSRCLQCVGFLMQFLSRCWDHSPTPYFLWPKARPPAKHIRRGVLYTTTISSGKWGKKSPW